MAKKEIYTLRYTLNKDKKEISRYLYARDDVAVWDEVKKEIEFQNKFGNTLNILELSRKYRVGDHIYTISISRQYSHPFQDIECE